MPDAATLQCPGQASVLYVENFNQIRSEISEMYPKLTDTHKMTNSKLNLPYHQREIINE